MRITILLEPVAKARPKVVIGKGRPHAYTPEKTAEFEEAVRWYFTAKSRMADIILKPTPISVKVTFSLTQPKKSKYDCPVSTSDIDNYCKSILDAGNSILWEDDSQIVEIHAIKKYASRGSIEMEVEEWTS